MKIIHALSALFMQSKDLFYYYPTLSHLQATLAKTIRTMRGKLKPMIWIATGGTALFAGNALYSGNPKFYSEVAMPIVQKFTDAESAHKLAIFSARRGIYPRMSHYSHDNMEIQVLNKNFKNPVGLSAGFDKDCEAIDGLLNFGFGFIEVGGVTPEPQPGNPKPRVFRLKEDDSVINRYGFNSCGHAPVVERMKAWYDMKSSTKSDDYTGIVGLNLGKNKLTEDPVSDYVKGVQTFGAYADFLVVNVSSPNTPGLRKLQGAEQLKQITSAVVKARDELERENKPAILVKIAPDLTEKDMIDIASVVGARDCGVDGLVISNTTMSRPASLKSINRAETGGLSGPPLKDMSTNLIRSMYKLTSGRVVIIGVGGIASGQDALDKIKAGASLVQIYTVLAYQGPPVVNRIKKELSELLEKEGFNSVSEAVGVDILGSRAKKMENQSE